jgi:hypothetical protein
MPCASYILDAGKYKHYEDVMTKRKAPKILIDDGLTMLGHLSQQGLLTHSKPEEDQPVPTASTNPQGGDIGERPKQPPQFTGL